jgi:hypothetical protein
LRAPIEIKLQWFSRASTGACLHGRVLLESISSQGGQVFTNNIFGQQGELLNVFRFSQIRGVKADGSEQLTIVRYMVKSMIQYLLQALDLAVLQFFWWKPLIDLKFSMKAPDFSRVEKIFNLEIY